MGESQSDQIADERWKALAAAIRPLAAARRKGKVTRQNLFPVCFARIQIEAALKRGIRVIPVLVNIAEMSPPKQGLRTRHAFRYRAQVSDEWQALVPRRASSTPPRATPQRRVREQDLRPIAVALHCQAYDQIAALDATDGEARSVARLPRTY